MKDLTSGHNVSDFYVTRPKPNPWIYLGLVLLFFIAWAYREGTAERSFASEAWFIVSIVALGVFVVHNLYRARAAKSQAHAAYFAFLSEHSKEQLELLLRNPTLTEQSAKLVVLHLRQRVPSKA